MSLHCVNLEIDTEVLMLNSFSDFREAVSFEARATYEYAIYVGESEQIRSVSGVHTPAIQEGNGGGEVSPRDSLNRLRRIPCAATTSSAVAVSPVPMAHTGS